MVKLIDTRDFNHDRATEARLFELGRIAAQVGPYMPEGTGIKMSRVNAMTGMPTVIEFLGTQPGGTSYVARSLVMMETMIGLVSFAGEAPPRFSVDSRVQKTRGGMKAVHMQQEYRGVPVFGMFQVVRFGKDDAMRDAAGDVVGLPKDVDVDPKVDVLEAAAAAVRHLAQSDAEQPEQRKDQFGQPIPEVHIDPAAFQPTVISSFPLASRPFVLDKGLFADDIPAHLVLFYQGPRVRLGWKLVFTMPEHAGQYAIIVGADDDKLDILYCQEKSLSAGVRMRVFRWNPRDFTPVDLEVPLPEKAYPMHHLGLPSITSFPSPWVEGNSTVGNSTVVLSSERRPVLGRRTAEGLVFAPESPEGEEQWIVNAFYFCNYMHDFFYLLGFDEKAGNFQRKNEASVGLAGDPLVAQVHRGRLSGTAYIQPAIDGQSPQMHLGILPETGRHTALDADVVFHEYVHGVTNRLVGGERSELQLEQPQSRGMGEGWGDYFGLSIQNYSTGTERTTVGSWLVNNGRGIRQLPYDENFPDHFGKLGTGRYREEHNVGEIWCATLMQLNRAIVSVLGDKERGYALCWQIVYGGLPLTRGNPSFLDARDGILLELDALRSTVDSPDGAQFRALRKAVWATFARFGMGPNARSNGASLTGIRPDFSVPEEQ